MDQFCNAVGFFEKVPLGGCPSLVTVLVPFFFVSAGSLNLL
jgi:hypothetical protein